MSSKDRSSERLQIAQVQAARQVTAREQCEFLATASAERRPRTDRHRYDTLRRRTAGSGEPAGFGNATPFLLASRSAFRRSSPISQMSSFMALLGGTIPRSHRTTV